MLNGGDYTVWVGLCSEREREDVIAGAYVPLMVKEPGPPHPERGVFWNCAEWEIRHLHQEVEIR